jgi:hypothetical protein
VAVVVTVGPDRALRVAARHPRVTTVARPRQRQAEFSLDHQMNEFPNSIRRPVSIGSKPIAEKVDSCLGCRLRLKLRGNVRHGVVSSPALQRLMIRG